jgi:hypothetical protein
MRQYLIDEIPRAGMEAVSSYLKEKTVSSGMEEIFWLEIPEGLLSPIQETHKTCGPHYLAIETGKDFVKFEFLVRCRKRLRCECVQYVTPRQESFLMEFAQTLIQAIDLKA